MTAANAPAHVLLVDDDPGAVEMLRLILEIEGFEARGATTLAEALTLARGWPFDVLLTDVQLPDGLGVDLATRLAAERPALFTVAMSGLDAQVVRQLPGGAALHHVLTKPLDVDLLLALLRARP